MSKCHESDQQGACCTCTYHITILSVSISLSITIKSIYASQRTTKHGVVPFGSIIIVNIKKFNYKEHSYVVHNYNAPPNALREVLVGKTTMCVKKKWGIKLMRENSYQQGQGFMRSVRRGRVWQKKTVSMQSHCRSLCLLNSARCLIAVRGRKGGLLRADERKRPCQ